MKMREEETELVDVFICPNCESGKYRKHDAFPLPS